MRRRFEIGDRVVVDMSALEDPYSKTDADGDPYHGREGVIERVHDGRKPRCFVRFPGLHKMGHEFAAGELRPAPDRCPEGS